MATSAVHRLKRGAAHYRIPIFVLALGIFVGGLAISMHRLQIAPGDLRLEPMLILALVLVPLTISYSAVNMMLMGHAANVPMRFCDGVRVSVYAQVAELLPIPGGMIVRTGALMKAGAAAPRSAGLVLGFAVLWIACAACGAGIAMWHQGQLAMLVGGGGGLMVLALYGWLARRFGHGVAMAALGLRVVGINLIAARFLFAFAMIGHPVGLAPSFMFAFAGVLGSAASLIPAGLGVSESLSAVLAGSSGMIPSAAFLAAALNRFIDVTIHLFAACFFAITISLRSGSVRDIPR